MKIVVVLMLMIAIPSPHIQSVLFMLGLAAVVHNIGITSVRAGKLIHKALGKDFHAALELNRDWCDDRELALVEEA